ncbi:hypothetical protein Angca_006350, partial [Angiostrongylus cantonensis]
MVKKKGKKFRPNLNKVARKRKALERNKKKCRSTMKIIKENWEARKTPRENLLSMGLAFSANEAVPVKQQHREIIDIVPIEGLELREIQALETAAEQRRKKQQEKRAVLTREKALKVISCLESDAAEMQSIRDESVRTVRLPDRDVELLIYLEQRYGDDYKV